MARTLRRIKAALLTLPLLALWVFPVAAGLGVALFAALDGAAWTALFAHPQLWPALGLSLFTGTASTLLALLCTLIIIAGLYRSKAWQALQPVAAAGLALPHLAFAIGFGFLIMPSGLVARIIIGGEQPPQWTTTQDPWGLALIAALVFKEIPFLFAMAWSGLTRGDAAAGLEGQYRSAASLGHGRGSIWLRIVQPQLLRQLQWPLIVVFVYAATVVDMALVIGPTQPPTFAVIAWHDLNDAESATGARGLAGAVFLTFILAAWLAVAAIAARTAKPAMQMLLTAGPSPIKAPTALASAIAAICGALTVVVMFVLALMSMVSRWPYPTLWPDVVNAAAWSNLLDNAAPLWLSLALGLATSATALLLAVLWFETQSVPRDRWLLGLALITLGLPQLVIAAGQYRLFLPLDLTGTLPGLFLVHLTPVLAYVAIVLAGPYRNFDPRYAIVARSLRSGPWRLWWKIKAPLLRGPLLTAAAVGFAVSIVQFVPAQLIAAGRHDTLPIEAVTLSAGGNRALTAAYALALSIPPLLAFAIAGLSGRPRWR
jgi:putative thiamine transport system permease protein